LSAPIGRDAASAGASSRSEAAARREGYRQLALLATFPGVPLYLACGFEPLEEIEVALSDGARIACVSMEKSIDPVGGANNTEVGREFASSN
jgi:hypothetical protein